MSKSDPQARPPGANTATSGVSPPEKRPGRTFTRPGDFNTQLETVHDLRHAHAACLLAGGADLKTVMELRMGRSHIMTTQKYMHTTPAAGAEDKALAAFEAVRRRSAP